MTEDSESEEEESNFLIKGDARTVKQSFAKTAATAEVRLTFIEAYISIPLLLLHYNFCFTTCIYCTIVHTIVGQ